MSTGLLARRATGVTGTERDEGFTWTESVTRWSREERAAYEAGKLCCSIFVFDLRKMLQPGGKYLLHRGRFFFPSFKKVFPIQIPLVLRYYGAELCFLFTGRYAKRHVLLIVFFFFLVLLGL